MAGSPRDAARQWVAARFLGRADAPAAESQMLVRVKDNHLVRHRIKDRDFLIKDRRFSDGVNMRLGEIQVLLPAGAVRFEAVVGVDSNDLGYYANSGRGSVIASVEAGGRELFRSGVLKEGMAGVPVKVELGGAREFTIKLASSGPRERFWQDEWDQANWGDARITLANGSVVRLSDLPAGPLPGAFDVEPPFSFRYDGKPSSELLKTWKLERDGLNLTYTDPATGLVVRAAGKAYDDYPVIEWTVYLRNSGSAPTPIIEELHAIDTRFERAATREFTLRHWRGSPNSPTDFEPLASELKPKSKTHVATNGGRSTDQAMCYFNIDGGSTGTIVALGWPGQWAADFERDGDRSVRVRAGQEGTHFRLMPGEEVRTPLVAVLFWNGDWIDGQNVWRRWMIAHNVPRVDGRIPTPLVAGGSNRQTIEMQGANEQNQLAYLKHTLDSGMPLDYWWMDAGWYAFKDGWWDTGTWDPDPARFPRGFTPISAAAKARGVGTIVWFEPERVRQGSWLHTNHPEWLLGDPKREQLLNLGNPDALRWLIDHVSRMIEQQGITFYREDFNFEPLERWRFNEAADRQGINEIKHLMGHLAYWDALRKRFPNLRIDTCASGGRRDDLETLRRSVPLWRSDYAYEPSGMQNHTYGMAFWMPFFGTGVNSSEPYLFRSQMTPGLAVGFDPAGTEGGVPKFAGRVKEWRSVVDLFNADYYPLTPYATPNTAWMAWQFNRPEQGDGMVQAFRRPDSTYTASAFPLRGLDAKASYVITDIDTGSSRTVTGSELMGAGLAVTISGRPGAVILKYAKVR